MPSKNLGLVKAIHSGLTPPANTKLIWFDENINLHKYFDVIVNDWVLLKPGYVKIPKVFGDFSAAATTKNIEIFSLPAGFEFVKHFIKHEIPWAGTGITDCTTELGITGDLSKYMFEPFDIFQVVGDTIFNPVEVVNSHENFGSVTSIRAKVKSTGANLDQLTAGTIDYYLFIEKIKQ